MEVCNPHNTGVFRLPSKTYTNDSIQVSRRITEMLRNNEQVFGKDCLRNCLMNFMCN